MEYVTIETSVPRFEVVQDDYAESPLEWGWDAALVVMRCTRNSVLPDMADTALQGVWDTIADYNDDADAIEAFKRHCERNKLGAVVDASARGYSQREWWDILLIGPDAEHLAPVFNQWLRGDVYRVIDHLTGDSISDLYADSEDDAIAQFKSDQGIDA